MLVISALHRPVGSKPASVTLFTLSGLECLSKVKVLLALQVERKAVKHNFAELRRYLKIKIVNLKNKGKLFLEKY